ncbi:hypothetical protein Pelo_1036 [Pelomyxa schiedti]|nr:hypothetical protein Pelo_1036 [Pelomyxa schiedti]
MVVPQNVAFGDTGRSVVGGVVDVSRMRVQLGLHSTGPFSAFTLSATHWYAISFSRFTLYSWWWTCHDSLVTVVSPTDATQGNCVCSSALLFLIRFVFFFSRIQPVLKCSVSGTLWHWRVATCQLLLKACNHQGKCEDCLCPFSALPALCDLLARLKILFRCRLTCPLNLLPRTLDARRTAEQSAMSGFTSASTHFTSALTPLALALTLILSLSHSLALAFSHSRSYALHGLLHSTLPQSQRTPLHDVAWPEGGFRLQAKEKNSFFLKVHGDEGAGTGTTWGHCVSTLGASRCDFTSTFSTWLGTHSGCDLLNHSGMRSELRRD